MTMIAAARDTGSSWLRMLFASFSDVALPSVVLAILTYTLSVLLRNDSKLLVLTSIFLGGVVYGGLFIGWQGLLNRVRKA